ncbi:hypothetical protein [Pseudoxanthomonas japonensis]|uniref:Phage integrase family protein n=1 Tax=Pseudoxanthomonas japonensis TaxID=69284 RepID=A0ABQ6ZMP9_9GAMM|nr:hypothetical protein [Pseudoxanthomonas japonensis]KAF1727545.1 hypothetical protein CSC78_01650 [Pseudoxanthomonas japonensis]
MAKKAENNSYLKFAGVDFDADTWVIKNETPGQVKTYATIQWAKPLSNGESLTNPQHRALLFSLKCFVWSLVYDPQESEAKSAGGVAATVIALGDLATFLTSQGIEDLDEITTQDTWAFAAEVVELHQEDRKPAGLPGLSRKPTHGGVIPSVNILTQIYRQRRAIAKLGGKVFKLPPYDGVKPFSVVTKDLGLKRGSDTIPPLPDQVAIPILNTAIRMIDESSDGLMSAMEALLGIRGFAKDWEQIRPVDRMALYAKLNELATTLSVPMPNGAGAEFPLSQQVTKLDADGREFVLDSPLVVLRYLLTSCVAACSIVLQAGTGLRSHELLSLKALPVKDDGWPSCLSKRVSRDGMIELFYVEAITSKRGKPRTAEWIVGARPAGSNYLPPTVRAILAVTRLLATFRELGEISDLFVVLKTNGGLPAVGTSVRPMTNGYLARFQRAFVLNWVDLSALSSPDHEAYKQGRLRPHQWRPTFATFVFRTNPTMLKAISEHFKHVSDAITSKYYIGNDPTFLAACDDAQTMAAVQVLRSITFKGAPVVGGFSRYVDEMRKELKLHLVDEQAKFDEQGALRYVSEEEIVIWNTSYGRCWSSQLPTKSLCNQRAGASVLASTSPNLAIAHVELCAGCSCLEISTEHAAYWIERRDQNALLMKQAKDANDLTTLAIVQRRQRQAEAMVKHLAS